MIMNTRYEEEVNGVVVGKYLMTGTLRYEGRQQGSAFYCENESQLKEKAESLLSEIKNECGPVFRDIFPKDAWELRINNQ